MENAHIKRRQMKQTLKNPKAEKRKRNRHLGNVDDEITEPRVVASLLLEPAGDGFAQRFQSQSS